MGIGDQWLRPLAELGCVKPLRPQIAAWATSVACPKDDMILQAHVCATCLMLVSSSGVCTDGDGEDAGADAAHVARSAGEPLFCFHCGSNARACYAGDPVGLIELVTLSHFS
jgi:hypothetical protein